ncbi:MAG: histidyl-tRNA synthetase [Actinomycetota bacterium]|nr:histidyl-tRNA synthetase [Actinomycetota bacterium]
MSRPTPISGFPEWLPAERIVEQHVIDTLRRVFELHGFAPVETRAVEPLEQLLRKGEIDKEVYVLRRLQADEGEPEPDRAKQLGLHYDLTVPFARYVLENAGKLAFPFRRYQIQKAWRGERPQEGRYREFTQADIDVIGVDTLAFHYEAEMPLVMAEVFAALPLPPMRMQVNNRKLIEGFYRGLGVEDIAAVLRTIDKLDKIGPDQVRAALVADVGMTAAQAGACLELAEISGTDAKVADRVRALGVTGDQLDRGLEELVAVLDAVQGVQRPGFELVADLRVARGLDYYTGTVYETQMQGFEHIGSVCSGGRYDALASDGRTTYPGVGISFGVTRTLGPLLSRGALTASRSTPTCVLVALAAEEARPAADAVATSLRRRGIAAEVAPEASKYGKQIKFAERRGIPYVWFDQTEAGSPEVRDIRSGEQVAADAEHWAPPAADLHPSILTAEELL